MYNHKNIKRRKEKKHQKKKRKRTDYYYYIRPNYIWKRKRSVYFLMLIYVGLYTQIIYHIGPHILLCTNVHRKRWEREWESSLYLDKPIHNLLHTNTSILHQSTSMLPPIHALLSPFLHHHHHPRLYFIWKFP